MPLALFRCKQQCVNALETYRPFGTHVSMTRSVHYVPLLIYAQLMYPAEIRLSAHVYESRRFSSAYLSGFSISDQLNLIGLFSLN